jgi:hypothetical protein
MSSISYIYFNIYMSYRLAYLICRTCLEVKFNMPKKCSLNLNLEFTWIHVVERLHRGYRIRYMVW